MINIRNIILSFYLFFFVFNSNALAYFDPGTGSFILQAIIAFLAAGLATATMTWNKLKNFLIKIFSKKSKKIK